MMEKVFACIDGSTTAAAVCDYAGWAARRMAAPLVLLHVLSDETHPIQPDMTGTIGFGTRESLLKELADLDEKRNRLALEQGRLMLDAALDHLSAQGLAEIDRRQRHGDLLDTLTGLQDECRLLIMGKRGEDSDSLGRRIGGHMESVVRSVHRPVLVTTSDFHEPRSFMIAFDGSLTTRKCVKMVAQGALFKGLPCHLVTVGEKSPERTAHIAWARQTLEAAGFDPVEHWADGEVETVLCSYRKDRDIDLLVMGAYGHSRIRQFLVGSTTTNIVREANVPVLLLR